MTTNQKVGSSSLFRRAKGKSCHESGRIFLCIIHYSIFSIHFSVQTGFSNVVFRLNFWTGTALCDII